jgi:hypothetical protein
MQTVFLTSTLFSLLFGSLIGGLILMLLAKHIGKISSATFGNSFIVCLIASAIYAAIWYLVGMKALTMSFASILAINLVVLSAAYVSTGKLVWKCTWTQSLKANSLWIVAYSLLTGFLLGSSI